MAKNKKKKKKINRKIPTVTMTPPTVRPVTLKPVSVAPVEMASVSMAPTVVEMKRESKPKFKIQSSEPKKGLWKEKLQEGTSEFFSVCREDAKRFSRESGKYFREFFGFAQKKVSFLSNKKTKAEENSSRSVWKTLSDRLTAILGEMYFSRPKKIPEAYFDGMSKGLAFEAGAKLTEAYDSFDESKLSWSNRKLTIPAAIVVALWMLAATISGVQGYRATHAAYDVYYGDRVVAKVGDRESFLAEVKEIEGELSDIHGMEKSLESEFRFEETYAKNDEITGREEVYRFVSEQTAEYGYGYELAIDGHAVGVAKSEAVIDAAMENVFHRLVPADQMGTAECLQEVKKIRKKVKTDEAKGFLSLANAVVEQSNRAKVHTVEAGESLVLLSEMFKIPYEQLKAWNPKLNDSPEVGEKVRLTEEVALSIRSTKTVEYDKSVAFETTVEKDDKTFVNKQYVKTEGENGVNRVVEEQVFENGRMVSKRALSETVVKKPTARIVVKGTKALPKYVASGKFLTPTRGRFTSGFGRRWGRMHKGIDIAGAHGTPIKAADGGKVIFAGRYYGLGNMVKVDHGNGYVTVYGHMSKIMVSVGQKVGKGEQIGKMGNTGNSRGTHLHFEVIYKGVHQNPKKYLP